MGVTAQVIATELKKPFASAATLIVEVADPPALTAAGVSAVAETVKSESNVAPTVCAALTVTLHVQSDAAVWRGTTVTIGQLPS